MKRKKQLTSWALNFFVSSIFSLCKHKNTRRTTQHSIRFRHCIQSIVYMFFCSISPNWFSKFAESALTFLFRVQYFHGLWFWEKIKISKSNQRSKSNIFNSMLPIRNVWESKSWKMKFDCEFFIYSSAEALRQCHKDWRRDPFHCNRHAILNAFSIVDSCR